MKIYFLLHFFVVVFFILWILYIFRQLICCIQNKATKINIYTSKKQKLLVILILFILIVSIGIVIYIRIQSLALERREHYVSIEDAIIGSGILLQIDLFLFSFLGWLFLIREDVLMNAGISIKHHNFKWKQIDSVKQEADNSIVLKIKRHFLKYHYISVYKINPYKNNEKLYSIIKNRVDEITGSNSGIN